MRNLISLSQEEVIKRAKTLYFDKMPTLDVIFADEYGRFDINSPNNLNEQARINNAKVFRLERAALYAKSKKD